MDAWFHCENPYPFVPQGVLDGTDSVRAESQPKRQAPRLAPFGRTLEAPLSRPTWD
jgi:hypothetical protein